MNHTPDGTINPQKPVTADADTVIYFRFLRGQTIAFDRRVSAAPDVTMRELLKDYATNKQFRRDIYVKGPQLLPQREQNGCCNQARRALKNI